MDKKLGKLAEAISRKQQWINKKKVHAVQLKEGHMKMSAKVLIAQSELVRMEAEFNDLIRSRS